MFYNKFTIHLKLNNKTASLCFNRTLFTITNPKASKYLSQIILSAELYMLFWLVLSYYLLEDRCIDGITSMNTLLLYHAKPIDPILLRVCSVTDHRGYISNCEAAPRVLRFCSDHILTTFVIYNWTLAHGQHKIYLLNE